MLGLSLSGLLARGMTGVSGPWMTLPLLLAMPLLVLVFVCTRSRLLVLLLRRLVNSVKLRRLMLDVDWRLSSVIPEVPDDDVLGALAPGMTAFIFAASAFGIVAERGRGGGDDGGAGDFVCLRASRPPVARLTTFRAASCGWLCVR